jgi:hypothetical protein
MIMENNNMKDFEERCDFLRLKKVKVELCNQDIIDFAYITKDVIEHLLHEKLMFEEANNYTHCFYSIRRLLKLVDAEYLKQHTRITEFYREGRELSNDWDRLEWAEIQTESGSMV